MEKVYYALKCNPWKNIFCPKLVPLLSTKKESFWDSIPVSPKKTTLLHIPSCSISEDKATDGTSSVIMAGAPQRCVWAADLLAPDPCLLRHLTVCSAPFRPVPPASPAPAPTQLVLGLLKGCFFFKPFLLYLFCARFPSQAATLETVHFLGSLNISLSLFCFISSFVSPIRFILNI